MSAKPRGSRWTLFGVLAMLCGLGAVAADELRSQELSTAIRGIEERSATIAASTVDPVMDDAAASAPLADGLVGRLRIAVASTLADGEVARIRIYSDEGVLRFSTDDGDRIGTRTVGDPALVTAAIGGATASVVDGDEVAAPDGAGSISTELLQVYTPVASVPTTAAEAVLQIDHRYEPIAERAATPWATVRIGAVAAGLVSAVLALANLLQWVAGRRQASRSGFDGSSKADRRHAKVVASLREEVGSLRDELAARDGSHAAEIDELREQLRAAVSRAERAATAPDDEALRDAIRRADEAAAALDAAGARATAAEARATAAEERAATAERTAEQATAEALAARAATPAAGAEVDAARAEVDRLERRVAELDTAAGAADAAAAERIASLTRRAEAAEARAAEQEALVARAGEADARVREAERRTADALARTGELERVAADARDRARAADEAAKVATEHAEVLARAEGNLRARLETVEHEASTARADAETARRDAEAARREIEVANATIEDQRARLADAGVATGGLEAELAAARADADALRGDVERLRADRDDRTRRHAELETSLVAAETRVRELAADADELRARLTDVDDRIASADRRTAAAESRLATSSGEISAGVARAQAELDAERERSRRLEARADDAEQRLTQLEAHASSLAHALEEERVRRQEAVTDAERATRDAKDLERRLAEAASPGGADEAAAVRAELETLRQEMARGRERVVELEAAAHRLPVVEAELAERVRAAQHAEAAWIERVRALEADLAAAEQRAAEIVTAAAGDVDVDETARLRAELANALERANAAEELVSSVQADLYAARSQLAPNGRPHDAAAEGTDADATSPSDPSPPAETSRPETGPVAGETAMHPSDAGTPDPNVEGAPASADAPSNEENGAEDDPAGVLVEGPSLRSRLARAADLKKGRNPDRWSG